MSSSWYSYMSLSALLMGSVSSFSNVMVMYSSLGLYHTVSIFPASRSSWNSRYGISSITSPWDILVARKLDNSSAIPTASRIAELLAFRNFLIRSFRSLQSFFPPMSTYPPFPSN